MVRERHGAWLPVVAPAQPASSAVPRCGATCGSAPACHLDCPRPTPQEAADVDGQLVRHRERADKVLLRRRLRTQPVIEVEHVQAQLPARLQVEKQPEQRDRVGAAAYRDDEQLALGQLHVLLERSVDCVQELPRPVVWLQDGRRRRRRVAHAHASMREQARGGPGAATRGPAMTWRLRRRRRAYLVGLMVMMGAQSSTTPLPAVAGGATNKRGEWAQIANKSPKKKRRFS